MGEEEGKKGSLTSLLKQGCALDRLKESVELNEVSLQVQAEELLLLAATWGRVDVLQWLLEDDRIKVPNGLTDAKGRNVLHIAAAMDFPELVLYLLGRGESTTLQTHVDANGFTALELASTFRKRRSVAAFLEREASFPFENYSFRESAVRIRNDSRAPKKLRQILCLRLRHLELESAWYFTNPDSGIGDHDRTKAWKPVVEKHLSDCSWWPLSAHDEAWTEDEQQILVRAAKFVAERADRESLEWLLDAWRIRTILQSSESSGCLSFVDRVALGDVILQTKHGDFGEDLALQAKAASDSEPEGEALLGILFKIADRALYPAGNRNVPSTLFVALLQNWNGVDPLGPFLSRAVACLKDGGCSELHLKLAAQSAAVLLDEEIHSPDSARAEAVLWLIQQLGMQPRLDLLALFGRTGILRLLERKGYFNAGSAVILPTAFLAPEDSECPICFETYDSLAHRPFTLSCKHVFCAKCTRTMWGGAQCRSKSSIPCPMCRADIPVLERGVDELVTNALTSCRSIAEAVAPGASVGQFLLGLAAHAGQLSVLVWLIQDQNTSAGAETSLFGGRNILQVAASRGDLKAVKWLCENGFDKLVSELCVDDQCAMISNGSGQAEAIFVYLHSKLLMTVSPRDFIRKLKTRRSQAESGSHAVGIMDAFGSVLAAVNWEALTRYLRSNVPAKDKAKSIDRAIKEHDLLNPDHMMWRAAAGALLECCSAALSSREHNVLFGIWASGFRCQHILRDCFVLQNWCKQPLWAANSGELPFIHNANLHSLLSAYTPGLIDLILSESRVMLTISLPSTVDKQNEESQHCRKIVDMHLEAGNRTPIATVNWEAVNIPLEVDLERITRIHGAHPCVAKVFFPILQYEAMLSASTRMLDHFWQRFLAGADVTEIEYILELHRTMLKSLDSGILEQRSKWSEIEIDLNAKFREPVCSTVDNGTNVTVDLQTALDVVAYGGHCHLAAWLLGPRPGEDFAFAWNHLHHALQIAIDCCKPEVFVLYYEAAVHRRWDSRIAGPCFTGKTEWDCLLARAMRRMMWVEGSCWRNSALKIVEFLIKQEAVPLEFVHDSGQITVSAVQWLANTANGYGYWNIGPREFKEVDVAIRRVLELMSVRGACMRGLSGISEESTPLAIFASKGFVKSFEYLALDHGLNAQHVASGDRESEAVEAVQRLQAEHYQLAAAVLSCNFPTETCENVLEKVKDKAGRSLCRAAEEDGCSAALAWLRSRQI